MLIYVLLKPLNIKQQVYDEIPALEVSSFTLYELNKENLKTIMKGSEAIQFDDRYVVSHIDFTDNSKQYIAKMKAKKGVYKNEIVELKGDVTYKREDGLTFHTNKATYNKKTNVTFINGEFISSQAQNKLTGSALSYNNIQKKANAKNITLTYQLKESN